MSGPNYYFLVSSLPMLHLTEELPITSDKFISDCRLHLSHDQVEILENVSPDPDRTPRTPVEKEWISWETYFRNAIAAERASQNGGRADQWLRPETGVFPGIRKQLSDAFSAANPAERELAIDEIRWKQLDDMEARHQFDFGALVIYGLRLQIAERWAVKDVGNAQENLNNLIDAIEDKARDH